MWVLEQEQVTGLNPAGFATINYQGERFHKIMAPLIRVVSFVFVSPPKLLTND